MYKSIFRELGQTNAPVVEAKPPVVVQASPPAGNKPPTSYTHTKIQVRLQNGSVLTETFDVKEQLSAVRLFITLKQGGDAPFGLMTSFPRKVFDAEDYSKPLDLLGLVPSAVIIVTKAS